MNECDVAVWPSSDLVRCPLFGCYEEKSGRKADILQ
jgi:hypothetical protein